MICTTMLFSRTETRKNNFFLISKEQKIKMLCDLQANCCGIFSMCMQLCSVLFGILLLFYIKISYRFLVYLHTILCMQYACTAHIAMWIYFIENLKWFCLLLRGQLTQKAMTKMHWQRHPKASGVHTVSKKGIYCYEMFSFQKMAWRLPRVEKS